MGYEAGEPPTIEAAEALFKAVFDPDRYDLSSVGRVKMNNRLNLKPVMKLEYYKEKIFLKL